MYRDPLPLILTLFAILLLGLTNTSAFGLPTTPSTEVASVSGAPKNIFQSPVPQANPRVEPVAVLAPEKTQAQKTDPAEVPAGAFSEAETFFNAPPGLRVKGSETASQQPVPASAALKQFGYDFFRRKDGFLPDMQAPVGPDYVVGPGDTMRVDVWGGIEGTYEVTVDRNGQIVLPKVGAVQVWGQSFAQARETIRKQIGKYFTRFELNVTMGPIRTVQVFLVGEVQTPGTYQVSSLSTVLNALAAAGGPVKTGSLRHVRLVRGGKQVAEIDFYDFLLRGDKSRDVRVQSGDTIFVPVVGPLVAVSGNVRRPAVYELKGGENLGQVLALAGGIIPTAYLQKIEVQRVEAHRQKTVLDIDLSKGKEKEALATAVKDRDTVRISPIALTGNYVKLTGYVLRPGDYQLAPGMRLADLLRAHDNLPPEFYPGMAQVVRRTPPEYRPEILSIHLQKALDGDREHNLELKEFDEIRLFAREEMEETPEVRITGAVLRPGAYRLLEKMTIKDLIVTAGNLKRMAYLTEAEVTRFTPRADGVDVRRFAVDLGKALEGDSVHNFVLQPDDHLIVRTIPDFGEKMVVKLQGEVVFPGEYVISKGERLSSLLHRAGGFTTDAYLRGSLFSRESLKEMQRQRMEKLMLEQEQEILKLSSEMTQGALSKEDAEAASILLENRKAMLEKMKQTPVTGRMVVHLAPMKEFTGSEYDIELMGGDTLVVSKNPQSVTVLGEVYNQTSLTYVEGNTVGDYLRKVGGTTGDANRGEMFVVRADGTVVSQKQSRFLVFNWFKTVELYPGDAILVPEKVERTDVMKELKDISTIVYQMALGAAAVAAF